MILIVCVLLLSGCTVQYKSDQEKNITILTEHAKGEVLQSNVINNSVMVNNQTKSDCKLYIQSDLIDLSGRILASNMEIAEVFRKENKSIQTGITLNNEIPTGRYRTKITIWDVDPDVKETDAIKQSISESEILYYKNMDHFDSLNEEIWAISSKKLGSTRLETENVFVEEGYLKIRLPKNELEGGELQSTEKFGHGIYEIRMKLPSAESSITGFFMYLPPDFYYEIDMELFNDPSGTLLLTTYAEGEVSNSEKYLLGIDATKEFHNYRFEYSEAKVRFYVDDKFIEEFDSGIPKGEMPLMVNCWYPEWRGLDPVAEERELTIDWIKY